MEISIVLKRLDQLDSVDWLPEFNEAKAKAYEFLSESLASPALTENQRVNAIRCLFKLRFHVSEERAFKDILKHCRSDSLRERSIAVRLASGMIALADACPVPSRPLAPTREDLLTIEQGLKKGVDEATEAQATEIVRGRL